MISTLSSHVLHAELYHGFFAVSSGILPFSKAVYIAFCSPEEPIRGRSSAGSNSGISGAAGSSYSGTGWTFFVSDI